MLWTIALMLALLWFLALVSSYTMGGLIVLVVRLLQGRRITV